MYGIVSLKVFLLNGRDTRAVPHARSPFSHTGVVKEFRRAGSLPSPLVIGSARLGIVRESHRSTGGLRSFGADGQREHDDVGTTRTQGPTRFAADVPCSSASRLFFRS